MIIASMVIDSHFSFIFCSIIHWDECDFFVKLIGMVPTLWSMIIFIEQNELAALVTEKNQPETNENEQAALEKKKAA